MKLWLNGDLLDAGEACIPPADRGFLLGEGVFETLRSYAGRAPTVAEHLERLECGCSALGLGLRPANELTAAVQTLLSENGLSDARIRITVTAPTNLVTASRLESWPDTAKAVLAPWPHNEKSPLAGVKTTSRADTVLGLAHARSQGADEAIFLNLAGNVCEAATANVFVVRGDRVETPPLSAGCLPGITRRHVLEVCAELGIEAAEADLPLDALSEADEVFLTSSTRGIQPLVAWPGGSGPTGPVTVRLKEQLQQAIDRLADRDSE
jgi:branched-chain amino acid aminotransferase